MALNLNTSPYYDDFSDSKRFHRILFKPGVPVQARELTQLQTILQDQMEKGFGFVLQEGAVITGCAENLVIRDWVKILDTDASSPAVAVDNTCSRCGPSEAESSLRWGANDDRCGVGTRRGEARRGTARRGAPFG